MLLSSSVATFPSVNACQSPGCFLRGHQSVRKWLKSCEKVFCMQKLMREKNASIKCFLFGAFNYKISGFGMNRVIVELLSQRLTSSSIWRIPCKLWADPHEAQLPWRSPANSRVAVPCYSSSGTGYRQRQPWHCWWQRSLWGTTSPDYTTDRLYSEGLEDCGDAARFQQLDHHCFLILQNNNIDRLEPNGRSEKWVSQFRSTWSVNRVARVRSGFRKNEK